MSSATSSFSLSELLTPVAGEIEVIHSQPGRKFTRLWNPGEANWTELTYITKPTETDAGGIITDSLQHFDVIPARPFADIILHPDPRYAAALAALPFAGIPATITMGVGCNIHPSAVVGSDGFGYETHLNNYFRMPHLGDVILGKFVDVGANTCIDRGTFSHTRIGSFTKIDNLVHIAHNCQIGSNVIIIAGAEVSGSVVIEDRAWIGPNASIMQGVTIGAGATIGIGAVVLRDVERGQTIVGHHRVIESRQEQKGVTR